MSSLLDSEVYSERQRLPGVTINVLRLLDALLYLIDGPHEVRLSVEKRGSVASSKWYTLQWGVCESDPGRHSELINTGKSGIVSAQTLELCLFRAAVMARRADERAMKYAGMEPQEKPLDETVATIADQERFKKAIEGAS